MSNVRLVLLAVLLALPGLAHADQLHLKDGSVLKGRIVSQQNGVIVFEGSVGRMEISQEKVDRVEYGEGGIAASAVASPVPAVPAAEPGGVWDAAPAAAPAAQAPPRSTAGAPGGLFLIPKIGFHQYGGAGWSSFGKYRHDFDGPTLELAIGKAVHEAPEVQLQLVGMTGWYGGSASDCDSFGTERSCFEIGFTNLFLHGGMRVHVPASVAFFYGQIGAGFHQSSFRLEGTYTDSDFPEDNEKFTDTNSRTTPSFHGLAGVGVNTTGRVGVFFEARFLSANGKFPDATESLDMGGNTFLVGASVGL